MTGDPGTDALASFVSARAARRRILERGAARDRCYGSFGLTDALYDWNTDVSDNKFVRTLIFFAMLVARIRPPSWSSS